MPVLRMIVNNDYRPLTDEEMAAFRVLEAIHELKGLDKEQRIQVFGEFCTFCGAHCKRCNCWRDE